MTIKQGDFVRAISPQRGLPVGSVWHVLCAEGGLKLKPFNESAKRAPPWYWHRVRFSPADFEKVTPTRDEYTSYLSRHVGPAFADLAARADIEAALDHLQAELPAGWGTSPRRAPTAATYKPAHGGYPGEVKA